jgi:hypothetical protein
MSKLLIALFVSAGLGLAGTAAAQMYAPKTSSTPMSKDAYTLAKKNASTIQDRQRGVLIAERKCQGYLRRGSQGQRQHRQG